jgi:hypothetical protein
MKSVLLGVSALASEQQSIFVAISKLEITYAGKSIAARLTANDHHRQNLGTTLISIM